MSYLVAAKSINNFLTEMTTTSERMRPALVVRQKMIGSAKCCCHDITCCKCNRTNDEQFSQINYLSECSTSEHSKFLTTEVNESSVSSR